MAAWQHILYNDQFATCCQATSMLQWIHHIAFTILTLLSVGRLRGCTFIHDPSPSSHLAPHSWAGTRNLKYSSQNQHRLFKCSDEVFPYKCIGQCPTPFNARNYWHVCLVFGQHRFTHEEISIGIHRVGHSLGGQYLHGRGTAANLPTLNENSSL